MGDLSYPRHFLHDIENMSDSQRTDRTDELIGWCKRYADGHANPKWVQGHMFELSRLAERLTARVAELEAERDRARALNAAADALYHAAHAVLDKRRDGGFWMPGAGDLSTALASYARAAEGKR